MTSTFSASPTAWAIVEVNMEDRVEVMRGENTQITCMFTSDDGIGGMIITWYYVSHVFQVLHLCMMFMSSLCVIGSTCSNQVTRSGEKQEIYQQDSTMRVVKKGTQFTERISVNGTLANGQVVLTISDVDISDEVEFICLIRSLTYGTAEGRTKLRVFGNVQIRILHNYIYVFILGMSDNIDQSILLA